MRYRVENESRKHACCSIIVTETSKQDDGARRTDLAPSRPLNYSNITNASYCLGIRSEQVKTLNLTLICVCSTAGISCVLAIIFILVSKRYKKFVYRLTLYLMVAILLVEVATILEAVPMYNNGAVVAVRKGFEGLCAVASFLFQIAAWMEMFVIFWITLYLLTVLVFSCNVTVVKWKQEVIGLTAMLILPFLFNWIPFIKDMYGISGPYCWIKQSMNSNCKYDYVGLALMLALLNGPEFSIIMFVFVSLVAIAIMMCKRAFRQQQGIGQPSIHQQGLKEVLPLLLYLLIYLVLWAIPTAFHIHDHVVQGKMHSHSLWLVHSIFIYFRKLFIPLICLLNLSTYCCRMKQKKPYRLNTITTFVVSNEFTDQEDDPLIVRGQDTGIPSKEYKSIFEGSKQ